MAFWGSISFQNLVNSVSSELESLHDIVMVWLLVIILVVLIVSYKIFAFGKAVFLPLDSLILEVTWTILPILILISIALPSLRLLCVQDVSYVSPKSTIKILSNQWNWQSEQIEPIDHLLDSEKLDEFSNYEVPIVALSEMSTRILLTSSDVLHSLGLPSLGIKLDSSPGRLNAVSFDGSSMSLLVGSCYELCGSGHSAMPIYFLMPMS